MAVTRTKVFARQSRRYFEARPLTVAIGKIWFSLGVSVQRPAVWETIMFIARVLRQYSILSTALLLALCTVLKPAYAQYTGTLAFNNVESGAAYADGRRIGAIGISCAAFDVIEGEGAGVLGLRRLHAE